MPTIFAHPLAAVGMRAVVGKKRVPGKLLAFGMLATILPDADVVSFYFDIAYHDIMGHRGFTHSIGFSAFMGLIGIALFKGRGVGNIPIFLFTFLCSLSHPLFDALTNGGLGVALFWPFDDGRYFFPVTPIAVSPIGARFFSPRGWEVIQSEIIWIGLPLAILMLIASSIRWYWRKSAKVEN